jgi:hypothetical protein
VVDELLAGHDIVHLAAEYADGAGAADPQVALLDFPPGRRCVSSAQWWRRHPDAWPVRSLLLGEHRYDEGALRELLSHHHHGDVSVTLARALIAARLNVAAGASPRRIAATLAAADAWIAAHGDILPHGVRPWSHAGHRALQLELILELWNRGLLLRGPRACDRD